MGTDRFTTSNKTERKAVESIRKDRQVPIGGFLAAVRAPLRMADDLVARISDIGALRYSVQISGHDDFEVADEIGISHGYMSKVLKGTAGLYGRRLVRFMRATNSIAPLQWLAEQMGCDVVQRDARSAEVAALRARLNELEKTA
jgi:hypothetical protein